MPESATSPQTQSSSSMDDHELDELFAAAESLANEITSPVAASETGDLTKSEKSQTVFEPATEAQNSNSSEIEKPEPIEVPSRPLNDLLHDPDAGIAGSKAELVASQAKKGPTKVSDASTPQEKSRPRKSVADLEAEVEQAAAEQRAAQEQGEAEAEAARTTAEQANPPEPKKKISFRVAMKACAANALIAGKAIAFLIPNCLMGVLILVDRPVWSLTPKAKAMIGAIGLATIMTGAAGWFLPSMLNHNPFEKMPPYRVEAAAAGEHSAEAESAPAADAEHAPASAHH